MNAPFNAPLCIPACLSFLWFRVQTFFSTLAAHFHDHHLPFVTVEISVGISWFHPCAWPSPHYRLCSTSLRQLCLPVWILRGPGLLLLSFCSSPDHTGAEQMTENIKFIFQWKQRVPSHGINILPFWIIKLNGKGTNNIKKSQNLISKIKLTRPPVTFFFRSILKFKS